MAGSLAESHSAWREVAALKDVPPGGCLGVEVGPLNIALIDIGGHIFATDNICTHQLAFLSEGSVDGEFVECPMH